MWKISIKNEHTKISLDNKINEIATLLKDYESTDKELGLMSGASGIALFLFYFGRFKKDDSYIDSANNILSAIIESLNNQLENDKGYNPVFSSGISGIFWMLNHLIQHEFVDEEANDILLQLDSYLKNCMLNLIESEKSYDFLHGSIGIASYFLERNESYFQEYQDHYINKLFDAGMYNPDTGFIKWESSITDVDNIFKTGFNLCLSHGMSSIIAYLTKYIEKYGQKNELCNKMLRGSLDYVMSYIQDPVIDGSYFPTWISDVEIIKYSRLAWCYGDLGIAYILYEASIQINDNKLKEKALEILINTTKRIDPVKERIVDAGLCHGAMGLTLIFNRMYNKTGKQEFQKISEYWCEHTLRQSIYPDGIAGYKSFQGINGWLADNFLLEGASGIGLSMISAISEIEPAWDNCLLLS